MPKQKIDPMKRVATLIVKYRYLIFLLFFFAAIYCGLSVGKVQVNDDLTAFLPSKTETRRGLTIMEEEFVTYATANVMLTNLPYDRAQIIAERIRLLAHVTDVTLDDSPAHYADASALLSVSFDGTAEDPAILQTMDKIRTITAPFDTYITSDIGSNYADQLAQQMVGVMLLTSSVIIAVLLFTSRSYFEVVIFVIVFAFAGLLNMGTNFWLGEISSITNSIAIILQLVLAIDYAIIFSHRYQDETAHFLTEREALIEALSKSIVEISSSSLTTISGLVALTLMQFRLGYDLGVVLSKGIFCSLITVFLLMPGLIMLFPRALKRTAHRSLIMDIRPWGRVLMKTRILFIPFLLVLVPFAIYWSGHTLYAFDETTIDELIYSPEREAVHRIADTFDNDTTIALLVPSGNYTAEKEILKQAATLDKVKSTTGLAGIESEPGHVLTDLYTPRMLSMLLGIDYERALLLYQSYGIENEQYQAIFGNAEQYEVPLIDMFLFLFEKIDQGVVTLEDDAQKKLNDLRDSLERGIAQLRGENWTRLLCTASVPIEGEQSLALVEQLRELAERYYGSGEVLVVGNITSARDLADSFNSDSKLINLLTIGFVFLILLLTFRSVVGVSILVFVIQSSIWINFSFPYLQNTITSFVTYMIVSAIQMGATIDYAIVLMNRYLALKQSMPKREAMVHAVNDSFPTVLTSGAIMTVAGLMIAYRVSDVYIGHIGLAVGRGSLISMILVLTVLPQLIVLFDRLIEKTTFTISYKLGGNAT